MMSELRLKPAAQQGDQTNLLFLEWAWESLMMMLPLMLLANT